MSITAEQLAALEAAYVKATNGNLIYSTATDLTASDASREPLLSLAIQHMPALIAEAKDAKALRAELAHVTAERDEAIAAFTKGPITREEFDATVARRRARAKEVWAGYRDGEREEKADG